MIRRILNSVIPPSSGQRFPALDGLRALAALGVVALHSVVMSVGDSFFGRTMWKLGLMSVCTFFVLSAFLLYYPLAAGKNQNIATYFKRRFFRIVPAYVMLFPFAVTPILFWVRQQHHHHSFHWDSVIARLFFVQTWMHGGVITLDGAWSLAPEVHFYLLLPLLVIIAARSLRRVILFAAAVLVLQTCISGPEDAILWHNLPLLLLPFFFGMLAALAVARYEKTLSRLVFLAPLGLLALYLFPLLAPFKFPEHFPARQGLLVALANPRGLWPSLACAAAVAGLATSKGWCARLLSAAWIRMLGICSYGMFLFNWPVFFFLAVASHGNRLIVLAGIPISIAIGIFSYFLVEAPAMRFGARKSAPAAKT